MDHIQPTTQLPPATFPALFKTYIVRSVQAVLTRLDVGDDILSDEVRNRALHVLSYALKLPEAWSLTKGLLLALAPKMERLGHYEDWIFCLKEGIQQSQRYGDHLTEGELLLHLGQLYRLQSNFDLARQQLSSSIAIFSGEGNEQGQARSLNWSAYIAYLQRNYDEASRLVEIALKLLDTTDPERGMSYYVQGAIALDHGRWQEAEDLFSQALELRATQGDRRKIASNLQNLGYVLYSQGKYKPAINYYEQAMVLFEQIHDPANRAIVQMNLGIIYYLDNKLGKALELYQLAKSVFLKFHNRFYLAKVSLNQGLCYLAMERWLPAEQAFLASVNLFHQLGDETERLNAVDGLGLTYLKQGLYSEAANIFMQGLTELSRIMTSPAYHRLLQELTTHLDWARQKKMSS